MRLGFDGHVLTGKFQGTRTTLGGLLRALARRDDAPEIVLFADNADEAKANLGDGPGLERIRYAPLHAHSSIKRLLVEFPAALRAAGADFGVFNYIAPLTGPSVVIIHDILPMTHGYLFPALFRLRSRLMFALSVRRAALVLCVSDYTARACLEWFGPGLARKLRTVPNGPSFAPDTYFAPRTQQSPRMILCVGRIEQRKNVPLLVEAFRRARLDGVELVIVGAQDQGFGWTVPPDPAIRHVTGIDDACLIALYRAASLFVYPSEAEGFGLPLLDAVLFGIPVISSNRTAMPEVAGDLAEYFDPCAPDAIEWLAQRLRDHFGDRPVMTPDEAQRRAHAARLSWDEAARKFIEALPPRPVHSE